MSQRARSLATSIVLATGALVLVGFAPQGGAASTDPAPLEARKMLRDSLELQVPKDFVPMPPETIKKTYAPDRIPSVVLMSPDAKVTLGVTHSLSRIAAAQMAQARTSAANEMKKVYPNAEWVKNEPNPIGSAPGYLLDLKINAGTDKASRMMIVGSSLSGRMLTIVLSAPGKDEAKWAPVFEKIVDSIKFL
jgi:hypothetical protein